MQQLLWKRIQAAYAQEQFDVAESWCRLAIHQLFQQCGDGNKSKIARYGDLAHDVSEI